MRRRRKRRRMSYLTSRSDGHLQRALQRARSVMGPNCPLTTYPPPPRGRQRHAYNLPPDDNVLRTYRPPPTLMQAAVAFVGVVKSPLHSTRSRARSMVTRVRAARSLHPRPGAAHHRHPRHHRHHRHHHHHRRRASRTASTRTTSTASTHQLRHKRRAARCPCTHHLHRHRLRRLRRCRQRRRRATSLCHRTCRRSRRAHPHRRRHRRRRHHHPPHRRRHHHHHHHRRLHRRTLSAPRLSCQRRRSQCGTAFRRPLARTRKPHTSRRCSS